jgi:hypothetical protein
MEKRIEAASPRSRHAGRPKIDLVYKTATQMGCLEYLVANLASSLACAVTKEGRGNISRDTSIEIL